MRRAGALVGISEDVGVTDVAGLVPLGVRLVEGGARLQWRRDGQVVESDFNRFRPVQLRMVPPANELRVAWRDFADLAPTDPFFRGTIDRAAALPERSELFETDWEVVSHLARQPDVLPLSGSIFHMARTGSTLVHRLLGKTGKVLSLSELGIIDRALVLTMNWPEEPRNAALRDLVGVLGRRWRPGERHLVLKMTDAVPNTQHRRFHAAFPEVPWIFIYRDPVEVMVSLLRGPTGNMRSWFQNRAQVAQRLGMPGLASGRMPVEEFIARTLRRFCATAVEVARQTQPGLFLAVPYARLPDAVWETIAPHFGIELSDADREAMRAEARYSAKKKDGSEFSPDSEGKREDASPRVLALAERFVAPIIEELQAFPQA